MTAVASARVFATTSNWSIILRKTSTNDRCEHIATFPICVDVTLFHVNRFTLLHRYGIPRNIKLKKLKWIFMPVPMVINSNIFAIEYLLVFRFVVPILVVIARVVIVVDCMPFISFYCSIVAWILPLFIWPRFRHPHYRVAFVTCRCWKKFPVTSLLFCICWNSLLRLCSPLWVDDCWEKKAEKNPKKKGMSMWVDEVSWNDKHNPSVFCVSVRVFFVWAFYRIVVCCVCLYIR